jgi:hypothetical protein
MLGSNPGSCDQFVDPDLHPDPHHFGMVTWIRIRTNKNPDPHQSDKLEPDPDPHQFADDKPKCMEYEPV